MGRRAVQVCEELSGAVSALRGFWTDSLLSVTCPSPCERAAARAASQR